MKLIVNMIAKNEEIWIYDSLKQWEKYADLFVIYDTGSLDKTKFEIKRFIKGKKNIIYKELVLSRSESMGIRDEQIKVSRKYAIDNAWDLDKTFLAIIDSDEIYPEKSISNILEELKKMEKKYYLGVRPLNLDINDRVFEKYQLVGPKEDDILKKGTKYWGDKYYTRFYRLSKLHGVCNPKWGLETFYTINEKNEENIIEKVPEGYIATQDTGKTLWSEIYYLHMSEILRSSIKQPRNMSRSFNILKKGKYEYKLEIQEALKNEILNKFENLNRFKITNFLKIRCYAVKFIEKIREYKYIIKKFLKKKEL